MSKKKNTKKKTAKTPQAKTKKPVNGIIIAAVAVLIAVAVAVAVFLVKKNDKPEPPSVNHVETLAPDGSKYTYAEYKGTKMPVEFVEILNNAEQDSYDACREYGVALELGDREISLPEFVMYYYDVYYFQTESALYSIQQTGANRTGYDLYKLPTEQKHPREEYMWSEQFTQEVIENMALNYMMFDEAVEAGVELSNSDISAVLESLQLIERGAKSEQRTVDEEIADTYCEGLTADMYMAREIVVAYATAYDAAKHADYVDSYSFSDVEAVFNKKPVDYAVARLRVYPIEGEYNEAEVSEVSNEKEFLEYANKNHPRDTYDANFTTECGYLTKQRLSDIYGTEVGEWAFAKGRKAGDIAVVQGMLFRYLVYMEVPAFHATSCDIMFVGTQYDESMTEETRKQEFEKAEKMYLEWKNGDGTKEGFWDYSTSANGMGEETVRIGDYYFEIDNWIHDPSRKSGDSVMLNTSQGCGAVYYIGKNEDDFDWIKTIKETLATEELKAHQQEVLAKDYEAERNRAVLNNAYDTADISILKHQKKLEEKEKQNK